MNRKTIQKCIDELNKEQFRKDYVLGMLETLIESLPEEQVESYVWNPEKEKFIVSNHLKGELNTPMSIREVSHPILSETPLDEGAQLTNEAISKMASINKKAIQTE